MGLKYDAYSQVSTTFRIIWPVHYFSFTPDTNLWHSLSLLYSHQTNRRPLPRVSPPNLTHYFQFSSQGCPLSHWPHLLSVETLSKLRSQSTVNFLLSIFLEVQGWFACDSNLSVSHTLLAVPSCLRICLLGSQNSDRLIDSKCGLVCFQAKAKWPKRFDWIATTWIQFNRKLF